MFNLGRPAERYLSKCLRRARQGNTDSQREKRAIKSQVLSESRTAPLRSSATDICTSILERCSFRCLGGKFGYTQRGMCGMVILGEPADKWDEDDAPGRFNRLSHDSA